MATVASHRASFQVSQQHSQQLAAPAGYIDVACCNCGDALFVPIASLSNEPPLCPACYAARDISFELWTAEKVLSAIVNADKPFDKLKVDERAEILHQYAAREPKPGPADAAKSTWAPSPAEREQIEDEAVQAVESWIDAAEAQQTYAD